MDFGEPWLQRSVARFHLGMFVEIGRHAFADLGQNCRLVDARQATLAHHDFAAHHDQVDMAAIRRVDEVLTPT